MANRNFIYIDSDDLIAEEAASVTTSAGAGDAGKLITLDAAGHVDATMINDADIDHGSIGGLGDDDHTQYTLADGTRAFSGDQSMGSNKLTNLADGSADNDAVNFSQLKAAFNNLDRKDSVKYATTAALPTYTGTGTGVLTLTSQTAWSPDGVAVANGDEVLVKDEGASDVDHGIFVVSGVGAEIVLTRREDANSSAEVNSGLMTTVEEGSTQSGSVWLLTTADDITLETTPIAFTELSHTTFTASLGVELVGTDFRADLLASGGLKLTGNEIGVEPADFAGAGMVDDGSDNLAIDWSTAFNDAKAVKAEDLNSSTNGEGASIIGIEDSAGNFTATNVEAALAELAAADFDGIEYTAATGGVTIGDLVEISGNDTAKPLVVANGKRGIGIAATTASAAASFKVLGNDEVLEGVLTSLSPTAGDVVYWSGSALSLTPTAGSGTHRWECGVAKNADDLHVDVRYIKKNI